MAAGTDNSSDLDEQRLRLTRSTRLSNLHWGIVLASLLVTVTAFAYAKKQTDANTQIQFDREVTQVIELVQERMQKYEDALWSGAAAIRASGGDMSHLQWRRFADSLHIDSKYPGINGIGIIRPVAREELSAHIREQRLARPGYTVHPPHERGRYLPIVYIEPEAMNAQAVGLDMAHEDNRYAAAMQARDTGRARITGPIVLVQDQGRTAGFLFFVPLYTGDETDRTEDRRASFAGLVYAPFVVRKLLQGTLQQDRRLVDIRIRDGDDVIYDELDDETAAAESMFSRTIDVPMYGRDWRFRLEATPEFQAAHTSRQPVFILLGGLAIDGLLLSLFIALTRASRRALDFADRVTEQLKAHTEALHRSNRELESFAYIASHDLKTPLRGIDTLTDFLEEDLAAAANDGTCPPRITETAERIRDQSRRMSELINGIMDYASLDRPDDTVETVEIEQLLAQARRELGLQDGQLRFVGQVTALDTSGTRLRQVLLNLIGNAEKYHHNRQELRIEVDCQETEAGYLFSVADNGPGIDPRFHDKIFEVFQTLQPKDRIDSSGIGLSIVKKSVETLGGRVWLESAPGEGATFRFEWPKNTDIATPANNKVA